MSDLALIAGRGRLPVLVAEAAPGALVCEMEGTASEAPGERLPWRVERLGTLLATLRERGVARVCLCGALHRPKLDLAAVDGATMPLLGRIAAALPRGDGATLRAAVSLIEEAGIEVVAPHALRPDLLPEEGVLEGEPTNQARVDAERAGEILAALGTADVGQGCVVAAGLCLAVEALPGTDHMLAVVAGLGGRRPDPGRGRGLLMKAPKPGQDRRVDLPAIGPETVRAAAAAGLGGIVVEAGGVLVLDVPAVRDSAREAGLFLWVRAAP
jgi:DUF1009 family protein